MVNNAVVVGHKYKIRSWTDMEEEYGLSRDAINMMHYFTPEMEKFCGETVVVISKNDVNGSDIDISFINNAELGDGSPYCFSVDMLEPIREEEDKMTNKYILVVNDEVVDDGDLMSRQEVIDYITDEDNEITSYNIKLYEVNKEVSVKTTVTFD
jgi:hypothetical protein